METTDLHVHVLPYDYYADHPVDTVGLARTATHIANLRQEATNSLLLDNGDFLQGNPMGDFIAYERGLREGDLHPVIRAMNLVGFDAAALGNHEFNYGLGFLQKALAGANFPILSANVITRPSGRPTQDRTLVPPYTILSRSLSDGTGARHQIKIGLIGFVPPQTLNWDRSHLEGNIATRDIIETAAAYVPQIKEQGADIIVALSHSGIGAARHSEGMENASVPLAAIDGIDAVLTGHSHQVFPSQTFTAMAAVDVQAGSIHGKPATMAGFWGSHLGLIDLMLEQSGNEWRVVLHASEARPIYERTTDQRIKPLVQSQQKVLDLLADDHAQTLTYIRQPVGRSDVALHSYFAQLRPDPALQLVADTQADYAAHMLHGTEHAELPLLSAVAPLKAGGRGGPEHYTDVPAGDLAIRNMADLYLYPNLLQVVRLNGAQIRAWLERAAGAFNQVTPGQADQLLLNPDFPSYNFDVISGLSYQIDLSQAARYDPVSGQMSDARAKRIVELRHAGQPLRDDQDFLVATNSFRAEGGGNFAAFDDSCVVLRGPDTIRDLLVRHITRHSPIAPSAREIWRFAPMPDTSALFDTGPGAQAHYETLPGPALTLHGTTPEGFTRFRVPL